MRLMGSNAIPIGVTTEEECCLPRIVLAMKLPSAR